MDMLHALMAACAGAGFCLGAMVSGQPVKTDPNKACKDPGHAGWAWVHDTIAHAAMGLSGYAKWAVRFHDWTSHKAWPRKRSKPRCDAYACFDNVEEAEAFRDMLKLKGKPVVLVSQPGVGYCVGVVNV